MGVLVCIFYSQEILALTGGGSVREYTETRPDGSTVTYTIDVEEEIIEVLILYSQDNIQGKIEKKKTKGIIHLKYEIIKDKMIPRESLTLLSEICEQRY